MAGLLRGDLGESIRTYRDVRLDIRDFLPATVELVTVALLVAVCLGVPFGILSAMYPNTWVDNLSRLVAVPGVALPRFWVGILLQVGLAYQLGLFPIPWAARPTRPGAITGLLLLDATLTGDGAAFLDAARHLVLPALTLALPTLAQVARLTRAAMIDVLKRPFMLVHAAYGVPPRRLVWRYGLRNGLTSVLTLVGMTYGALIENAFLVEVVSRGRPSAYGAAGPREGLQRGGGRDARGRAVFRAGQRAGGPPVRLCRSPRPLQLSRRGRGRGPGAAAGAVDPPPPSEPLVDGGRRDRPRPDRLRPRAVGPRALPGGRRPERPLRPRRPAARSRALVRHGRGGPRHLQPTVYGSPVSLTLVVAVLGIALGAGVPLGLAAGYGNGRWTSAAIMRVTDIFLAVPPLALALAVTAAFRPDLGSAALAISFTWWPWYTRLVYGEVLARRQEPYVEAARALGSATA